MSHKKNNYSRIVRRWHGHVGVIATIFLVLLVLTGIVLNHEEALKLDKREINASWLMSWYGIHEAETSTGYLLGERYFSWEGDDDEVFWFRDQRTITKTLTGAFQQMQ